MECKIYRLGLYAIHASCYAVTAAIAYALSQGPGEWFTYSLLVIVVIPVVCGLLLGRYAFGCALCYLTVYVICANYWLWKQKGEDHWSDVREHPVVYSVSHLLVLGSSLIAYVIQRRLQKTRERRQSPAESYSPAGMVASVHKKGEQSSKLRAGAYRSLWCVSIGVGILAGCVAAISLFVALVAPVWSGLPRPLRYAELSGGIVRADDGFYIGSRYFGHIYKFDYNGRMIKVYEGFEIPFRIEGQRNEPDLSAIVVHHDGREQILERVDDRRVIRDNVQVQIRYGWFEQPILLVRQGVRITKRASLQPWYVTAIQTPYPGVIWYVLTISSIALAGLFRRRMHSEAV